MNKGIFSTKSSKRGMAPANTTNAAGGLAYSRSDEGALAQLCATGCLNSTYYTDATIQLNDIVERSKAVSPEFIAKLAVYCREDGLMKDTPALLCAILSTTDEGRTNLKKIFHKVINNGKMLRNFVQIIRSGVVGRTSLGSCSKKLIQKWFANNKPDFIFKNSIGNEPSISDVIKLSHPRAETKTKNALFKYLMDKDYNQKDLPQLVKEFEQFKKTSKNAPDVPFQMIASLDLSESNWKQLAGGCSWQTLRMNLNTFARHNVFSDKKLVTKLAARLSDREEIKRAGVFPYQLLNAYVNCSDDVPYALKEALQDAMEIAVENVPVIDGRVFVCLDTSGSMSSPITGNRGSVTTKVRCIDVAALVASSIMRRNPKAVIIPFDTRIHKVSNLNSRDSVMTNATKLASYGGGGTDCSAAMRYINSEYKDGDVVIYVSDNESWADSRQVNGATGTANAYAQFKKHNPKAKMIFIDLVPHTTYQIEDAKDVLNVGGFSDSVFSIMGMFLSNGLNKENWVGLINKIDLDEVD